MRSGLGAPAMGRSEFGGTVRSLEPGFAPVVRDIVNASNEGLQWEDSELAPLASNRPKHLASAPETWECAEPKSRPLADYRRYVKRCPARRPMIPGSSRV